jgi:hypothetical protein
MHYGTAWGGDDRPSDEPVRTPLTGFAVSYGWKFFAVSYGSRSQKRHFLPLDITRRSRINHAQISSARRPMPDQFRINKISYE